MKRSADATVVARQLGRAPRSPWRVMVRCAQGYPQVIASPPVLDDATPFPSWLYLTCPHLCRACAARESEGALAALNARLTGDTALRAQLLALDVRFRAGRAAEATTCGQDSALFPGSGTGVAGQADPRVVKCLHAHVACELAGLDDPLGAGVIASCEEQCSDPSELCDKFLS